MKKIIVAFALLMSMASWSIADETIVGFSAADSKIHKEREVLVDGHINASNMDAWMKRLTARPHHLGSPYGKGNAEFIAGLFKSWGYDTEIVTYHVLMPTPKRRHLEMLTPTKFTAGLKEASYNADPTSNQDDRLPSYNAYSPDGDVTAEVVFVNQGLKKDYEDLKRRGIDVRGKIVLAKYGGSWRGIKPKIAQEMGAIGVILYTDPGDDGYAQGLTYPEGPYKPATGVQRGSIMDLPMRPGDPMTPYIGATKDAKRLKLDEIEIFVKIPVLPISATDALPLLKALQGPVAPARWRGGLPITYRMGAGKVKVNLAVAFNWDLVPLYNVIAKMEGAEKPDEWVMRGNHHDAWVHGAQDPISGLVVMMEEARAISELAKTGWRPKRTLVYGAWDGEEQGLLGSVEWVEDNRDMLSQKLVAYLNTDGTGRGFISAGGSHTLETMFNQVVHDVKDPDFDMMLAKRHMMNRQSKSKKVIASSDYSLNALGSGSDYSGFFQHLGIASMNIGFGGLSGGGSYHTNYDSYSFYTRFTDPGFKYSVTLGKVMIRTTLRLLEADLLPFDFKPQTKTIDGYLDELITAADTLRSETDHRNKLIADGVFDAAHDVTKPWQKPEPMAPVPHINFAPLQNAMAALKTTTDRFSDLLKMANALDQKTLDDANRLFREAEAQFIREHGLPRRPWYRHHIYAPGFYTGYGVKTLPGVREGLEERKYDETQQQIDILTDVLSDYRDHIEKINALLAK